MRKLKNSVAQKNAEYNMGMTDKKKYVKNEHKNNGHAGHSRWSAAYIELLSSEGSFFFQVPMR